MDGSVELLAVQWEWQEGENKGYRFWGTHLSSGEARVHDWIKAGARPLGAARVTVTEGEGLELLPDIFYPGKHVRKRPGDTDER